ncbi:MAG: hypothetical protein HN842_07585, partial [Gammaproteobacteria bacterium]|nr:hypothetical protein [Gammaproteobacteria bacterium]
MARFHWKGFVAWQRQEGDIDATDESQAKLRLTQQHVTVLELKQRSGSGRAVGGRKKRNLKAKKGKVPEDELLVLLKKLSSMVDAGLPILEALSMVRDQANSPAMLYALSDIYQYIERGHSVSDAFARHPETFDSI